MSLLGENPAYSTAVRLQPKTPSADDEINQSGVTPAPLRWLDIGTGSGLLASLVAVAASTSTIGTSAVEVYACEGVAEVADVAAETFAKNGGNVRLFRRRSTEMEVDKDLPCRVPLVISELLGTGQSVGRLRILQSTLVGLSLFSWVLVLAVQRSIEELLRQL